MVEPPVPLTALSEDQRAQAHSRFTIIRPALEDGVTQAQIARTYNIPSEDELSQIRSFGEIHTKGKQMAQRSHNEALVVRGLRDMLKCSAFSCSPFGANMSTS